MPDLPLPGFPNNLRAVTVTIASGAAASEMVATQGDALVGILTPSNGWTAAGIGYKACLTGRATDLVDVYDNSGANCTSPMATRSSRREGRARRKPRKLSPGPTSPQSATTPRMSACRLTSVCGSAATFAVRLRSTLPIRVY